MTVSVGDHVPECTLYEYFNEESDGCSVGPNAFKMSELVKGKRIALFALPGAYTPTCSAKHLPGYVEKAEALKEKVDEIWCVSVNDAFVMGAWARDYNRTGSVRMMADGSAEFTKAVGMDLDLTERGLGVRSRRYSMLLDDGIIKTINLEDAPGGMEVSDADTMLDQV